MVRNEQLFVINDFIEKATAFLSAIENLEIFGFAETGHLKYWYNQVEAVFDDALDEIQENFPELTGNVS